MLDDDEVGLGQARSAVAEQTPNAPAPNDNLASSELRQTFLASATWDE